MEHPKYILLFLCISSSFVIIAQDTLVSKEQRKEFPIGLALKDALQHTSGLNYPYVSDGNDVIYVGAFNVPRGAVRLTAGERQLLEGIDFTVNYQVGTVHILDPSFAASKVPIYIMVEK